jgi:hypothetical protein
MTGAPPLGRWQRGDGRDGANAAFLGSLVRDPHGDLDQVVLTGHIQERLQHRLAVAEDQALELLPGKRPRRHGPRQLDDLVHPRPLVPRAL